MNEREAGFRKQLQDLADYGLWREWDEVRLVFADWLEEQEGREAEAALTRAPWSYQGMAGNVGQRRRNLPPGQVTLQRWHALTLTPVPVTRRQMDGCTNAYPLLHFPPRTLRLTDRMKSNGRFAFGRVNPPPWQLSFTWLACQTRGQATPNDTSRHPLGLAGLFLARPMTPDIIPNKTLWEDAIHADLSQG